MSACQTLSARGHVSARVGTPPAPGMVALCWNPIAGAVQCLAACGHLGRLFGTVKLSDLWGNPRPAPATRPGFGVGGRREYCFFLCERCVRARVRYPCEYDNQKLTGTLGFGVCPPAEGHGEQRL